MGIAKSLLSSSEEKWILSDIEIDLPAIYTDICDGQDRRFSDPISTGQKESLHNTLDVWAKYQNALLETHITGDQSKMVDSIYKALECFYEQHGGRETQLFIERLWKHRWIYDADFCAHMLLTPILAEIGVKVSSANNRWGHNRWGQTRMALT
ncbi:MAG: hypothetical protein L3J98_14975 [Gammaproteobacteria bacterium]|nr:hypothetical protein [Gammaproteobacteria bacterium]MCF6261441.1 hypothetical protein [Gammaproteobacteria bacterium]